MIKPKYKISVMLLLLVGTLLVVTISCDLFPGQTHELRFYNRYNEPVTIHILGTNLTAEIPSYATYDITLEEYGLDYIIINAEGLYFSYYLEHFTLSKGGLETLINLKADSGWLGLMNLSSTTISGPKYYNDFFTYDENGEYIKGITISHGETRYLKVDKNTPIWGNIVFSTPDYQHYKITTLSSYPEIGESRTIILTTNTQVEKVNY